jgi:hypothetical protein
VLGQTAPERDLPGDRAERAPFSVVGSALHSARLLAGEAELGLPIAV